MEAIGTVLWWLKEFYAAPFTMYASRSCGYSGDGNCAHPTHDVVPTIIASLFVLAITAMVLWVLWSLFGWLHRKYVWYTKWQHCTHCHKWTLGVSQGKFSPVCPAAQPCCPSCSFQHRLEGEPKVSCPKGHGAMEKVGAMQVLIYDRCGTCEGVFLDDGELDQLRQWARDEGYSSGNAGALAIGIAVGSAIS